MGAQNRCAVCGRSLTAPASALVGVGPVCSAKHTYAAGDLLSASFEFYLSDGVIVVIDLDQGRSVTNDADNVVARLAAYGLPVGVVPVVYRDTLGVFDQLDVSPDGRFVGFVALGAESEAEAIRLVRM